MPDLARASPGRFCEAGRSGGAGRHDGGHRLRAGISACAAAAEISIRQAGDGRGELEDAALAAAALGGDVEGLVVGAAEGDVGELAGVGDLADAAEVGAGAGGVAAEADDVDVVL